jgi:hypothetical protein
MFVPWALKLNRFGSDNGIRWFLCLAVQVTWADIIVTNSGDQSIFEGSKTSVSFKVTNNDTYTVNLVVAELAITVGPNDPGDWVHFGAANGKDLGTDYTTCSKPQQFSNCKEVIAFSLAPGEVHTFAYDLITADPDPGPLLDTANSLAFGAGFSSPSDPFETPLISTLIVQVSDTPEPSSLGLVGAVFLTGYLVRNLRK